MEIRFTLEYHELVIYKDISVLDETIKHRIKQDIEKKLKTFPHLYGKPLRGTLHPYYKLRTGDYRVIYRIYKSTVRILAIKHRNCVYRDVKERR
jgi:mRNA interferase RelE/StbE